MKISSLDHLVLTVADIENSIDFYCSILGMELVDFGAGRKALSFGEQKINLHQLGSEFMPNAAFATPGSADLCFISTTPVCQIMAELQAKGVEICDGPVERTGAMGAIESIYLRDPDLNLIELSNYIIDSD